MIYLSLCIILKLFLNMCCNLILCFNRSNRLSISLNWCRWGNILCSLRRWNFLYLLNSWSDTNIGYCWRFRNNICFLWRRWSNIYSWRGWTYFNYSRICSTNRRHLILICLVRLDSIYWNINISRLAMFYHMS